MRPGPREAVRPARLAPGCAARPARVPHGSRARSLVQRATSGRTLAAFTEHRFWADFGDFSYFRMHNLKAVNYVGGFARAGSISPEEYMGAMVDPIQAFAPPSTLSLSLNLSLPLTLTPNP